MILYNGKLITNITEPDEEITLSEYNALSEEDKMKDINYFVTDVNDEQLYADCMTMYKTIGDISKLSGYADGTIAGTIKDLYNRMGGMIFKIESDNFVTEYDGKFVTKDKNFVYSLHITDESKSKALLQRIGEDITTPLKNKSKQTIVDCILDLYDRLNGFEFTYNEETDSVEITHPSLV